MTRRGMLALLAASAALPARAQDDPLRIEITEGVMTPMPVAVVLTPDRGAGAADDAAPLAQDIAGLIGRDLVGTGLFTLPAEGVVLPEASVDLPVAFAEWRAVEIEALVTGSVRVGGDRVTVSFRLFDVFARQPLGEGIRFEAPLEGWRRTAHKIADQVYSRITGERPYFDSRIAFVGESGPPDARVKRIGVMDHDGAQVQWLTGGEDLVLSPRFSPDGGTVFHTSYVSGLPQIVAIDLATLESRAVTSDPRAMSFAPRVSPDGRWLAFSRENGGNTDIWQSDLTGDLSRRLTSGPAIDTAPSWSPDGGRIAFESDRSGSSQIYVMNADGGALQRISFGAGRHGAPAWSPRGDLIAFSRQSGDGSSVVGVMRPDGSGERLLTSGHDDQGPDWSPNGRVLVFTRHAPGQDTPRLHMVDITGRYMRPVAREDAASDPCWGPLLR